MAESEEDLKSLLMKMKEENEKADLELSIKKSKIMASSPITSWQIEGEKVEVMTDFNFTVNSDCSLQKMLAPWKKSHDETRSCIKNQRHHFDEKGPYSQSYGFSSSHVWLGP